MVGSHDSYEGAPERLVRACLQQIQMGSLALKSAVANVASNLKRPLTGKGDLEQNRQDIEKCRIRAETFLVVFRAARYDLQIAKRCCTDLDTVVKSCLELAERHSLSRRKRDREVALTAILRCVEALSTLDAAADEAFMRLENPPRVLPTDEVSGPVAIPFAEDKVDLGKSVVFRFLHLTDRHTGAPGHVSSWDHVYQEFVKDLKEVVESAVGGEWDAVLFTGDSTHSSKEFDQFDEFLDKLWLRWSDKGWSPPLLSVPGNHDLTWPDASDARVTELGRWHAKPHIPEEFWTKERDSQYYPVIADAFKNYSDWWKRQRKKPRNAKVEVRPGFVPGDFSATIEKDGVRLGILGLNSTFLHLTDKNHLQKLALATRQFGLACDGDGPLWAGRRHHLCLLMTHHPPDWLHELSRGEFDQEIFSPARFALHLCGHLHIPTAERVSRAFLPETFRFAGRSLFGRPKFGERGKKKRKGQRTHGYAAIRVEIAAKQATLRIWPRTTSRDLSWKSVPDSHSLDLENEGPYRDSAEVDVSHAFHPDAKADAT